MVARPDMVVVRPRLFAFVVVLGRELPAEGKERGRDTGRAGQHHQIGSARNAPPIFPYFIGLSELMCESQTMAGALRLKTMRSTYQNAWQHTVTRYAIAF